MPSPFSKPYRIPLKDGLSGPGTQGIGYGPPPTDQLTLHTKDEVFKYQLQLDDAYAVTEDTLLVAKICETSHYAKSVHKTLVKKGILDAKHHCDTTHVGGDLVSSIAIISVPKVRELVDFLFWFEEECKRWSMLEDEKKGLEQTLGKGDASVDEKNQAESRMMEVNLLRQVIPSQRSASGDVLHGRNGEDSEMEPPKYVQ